MAKRRFKQRRISRVRLRLNRRNKRRFKSKLSKFFKHMSTTFTWTVNTLDRTVADGIVGTVHYSVSAADDTYSSGAYGSVGLEAPAEGDTVIPYADLTESQCIEWVKAALGGEEKVTEIQTALQNQLDEQRTPTKAQGTPWS